MIIWYREKTKTTAWLKIRSDSWWVILLCFFKKENPSFTEHWYTNNTPIPNNGRYHTVNENLSLHLFFSLEFSKCFSSIYFSTEIWRSWSPFIFFLEFSACSHKTAVLHSQFLQQSRLSSLPTEHRKTSGSCSLPCCFSIFESIFHLNGWPKFWVHSPEWPYTI